MPELAYVNGTFCDPADAVVSIEDRGFQFADGVYEVVVAYAGEPFRLEQHLKRLRRSLSLVDIHVDPRRVDMEAIIRQGIERSDFAETLVYLQVTRGRAPRSHVYLESMEPTIVATFKKRPAIDPERRAQGVSIVTVEDTRWSRCEIKSIALLPNILAKNQAMRDGYYDAVFVSESGAIREATAANVFIIQAGTLVTPETDETILHGVTRDYILECAQTANIPIEERRLSVTDLESADEAFLSSTTLDVLAITKVNATPIAPSRPGPLTSLLYQKLLDGLPPH